MADDPRDDRKSTDPKHTMFPEHADTRDLPPKEDEMLPADTRARQMPVPSAGGDPADQRDTAGEHGDMAPEAASGLERTPEGEE